MRAVPLPVELVKLLEANEEALKCLRQGICDNVLVQTLYKNLLSEGVRWLKEAKGTWWSKQSTEYLRCVIAIVTVLSMKYGYLLNYGYVGF